MKTKPTPGPWQQHGTFIWSPVAKANIAAVSGLRSSLVIEYVPPELGDKDLEEIYANARLLTAAPELLIALETVPVHRLCETPEEFIERFKQWYREARNPALTKAGSR